jgi:DNA polymerase-3 subunit gamma/tau
VYSEGYDLSEFLNGFEEHYRNLLVVKTLGNFDQVNVAEHYHDKFSEEAGLHQETDILAYIKQIGEIQNEIKWATQPNLKFELGILKMAKLPTTLDIETLLEKIDLLKKKNNSRTETHPLENSSPAEVTLSALKNFWPEITSQFKGSRVNLSNALELAEIKSFQDSRLTVEYANAEVFYSTWLTKHKRIVEETLFKKFSSPVRLVITNMDKPAKGIKNGEQRLNKKEVMKQIENDPVLNKLIDDLGLELT